MFRFSNFFFFFLLDGSVASHRAFGFKQHHRKLDIETRCPSDTKACLKTFSVFSDIINVYKSCVKHLSRLELTFHGLTPSPPPPGGQYIIYCFVNLHKGEVVKGLEQFFSEVWKSAPHTILNPPLSRCLAPKGGVISSSKLIAKPP